MSTADLTQPWGGLARAHRPVLALAAVLILVEAALELARPWPLQFVVDHVLGGRPLPAWADGASGLSVTALAAASALALLVVVALGAVASAAATILVGRAAEGIGCSLRDALVGSLLDHPPAFFRRRRTAELVTRVLGDVERVEDAIVAWWEVAVPEAVVLLGTLGMLLVIDPGLAGTAVAVCPVLAAVIVHRRRLVRRAQEQARECEGQLSQRATDLLRNVRVVQAFGQQRHLARRFAVLNAETRRANVRTLTVQAGMTPLVDLILGAGAAAVLVLGVARVEAGAMTTGTLLVALTYVAGLYAPLRSLTSLATTLARAQVSRDRLQEVLLPAPVEPVPAPVVEPVVEPAPDQVLDLVPPPAPAPAPAPPADGRSARTGGAALESVRFGYGSGPVLDEVSLCFPAGRTTALTGPTGAGKSTVLSLLLCFERPQSGRVLIGGRDLRERDLSEVRRGIAYVPQESWFLDDTLRANILLGAPEASERDVAEAARLALVTDFAQRLPHGLDTDVGEGGLLLSGGERKRLALARAVVRGADLLLLDEPTAGLDDRAAAGVLEALSGCAAGRTTVVVTHDPRVVRWADEIRHLPGPVASLPPHVLPTTQERR